MVEHRLLRASAGTGKTWQLTETYVSLITEAGLRPREIVAITFTRKAAAELKLRIRARLRQAGMPEALFTELARAPITNFHGLALQLMRRMGSHAGVRAGTRVLGDGDDARMFTRACEAAWFADNAWVTDTAADAAAIRDAVTRVAAHMDVAFTLPDALWEALSRAREDGHGPDAGLWGTYDARAAQAAADVQLQTIAARLAAGAETITGKGRDKLQAFLAAWQAPGSGDPPLADGSAPWAAARAAAFKHLDRRGKLGTLYTAEDKITVEQALAAVPAEALCAVLVAPLSLLATSARARYEADKSDARAMDFVDIIARVVGALQSDAALHAEATRDIRAVLVDEAQDTNFLQRDMIRLLAGLAGPAPRPDDPARLIVVGDRKQCIYTFRGADPRSFDLFADDIAALGGTQTRLAVSRRSRPHLVAGINHLGEYLFGSDAYEALEPLPAPEGPPGGMTWVPLLSEAASGSGPNARGDAATNRSSASDTPARALDAPDAPTAVALEAQSIAALIADALQEGVEPSDFAVLLASMTHAPVLAQTLAQAGIPAVVGGGGGLLAQPEVQDVLALLTWLCDPGARLAAAIALRSPLMGLSDGALSQLLHRTYPNKTPTGPLDPEQRDPLRALSRGCVPASDPAGLRPGDAGTLAQLAAWLPAAQDAAKAMQAADCLAFCDVHLHMRAAVRLQARGAQKAANIERLFDLAARFDQGPATGVEAFVRTQQERLARGHDEPVTPAEDATRTAVRVCSVHQSKGLQFPRVILAFLNRRGRNATSSVRYDRHVGLVFAPRPAGSNVACHTARWRSCAESQQACEDAELRRLLYVAVTRAEERVYFVGDAESSGTPAGFARYLLPWREQALAAGVLREHAPSRAGDALARVVKNLAGNEAAAACAEPRLMRSTAPSGAALETTVTALAQFAVEQQAYAGKYATSTALSASSPCVADGSATHAPLTPGVAGARAKHLGTKLTLALEPRLRGHLVHRVLSAVSHRSAHNDTAEFVTAQLEIAGFSANMPAVQDLHADLVAFLDTPSTRPMLDCPPEHRRHELPFLLHVPHAKYHLTLRGQLDLLYRDNEGPVIVDYKHAHKDAVAQEAYLFQLDAYALAVARMCNIEGPIRTRLVYLRDRGASPHQHVSDNARRQQVEATLRQWADNNA